MSNETKMNIIWFSSLLIITCVALTGIGGIASIAYLYQQQRAQKNCDKAIETLMKVAWEDPDAFDIGNMLDTGVYNYMCPSDGYEPDNMFFNTASDGDETIEVQYKKACECAR